jgi:hypothetical protein
LISVETHSELTPGTVTSADATCTSGAWGQVTCNLNDLDRTADRRDRPQSSVADALNSTAGLMQ